MRRIVLMAFFFVAACSTPQADYCGSFGVYEGSAEYGRCLNYYEQQQALFTTDRAVCAVQADVTYPPSLYSRPTSFPVRYYGRGGFGHTEMVHVGADYQQNAALDRMRMTIIEPCMQARGWNSGVTWQAGRHAGAVSKPAVLPWQ